MKSMTFWLLLLMAALFGVLSAAACLRHGRTSEAIQTLQGMAVALAALAAFSALPPLPQDRDRDDFSRE